MITPPRISGESWYFPGRMPLVEVFSPAEEAATRAHFDARIASGKRP